MANSISSTQTATIETAAGPRYQRIYVWQWPIRAYHWLNMLCLMVLFTTGLCIAYPVFTSGGEAYDKFVMGRFRQVHFATAHIFFILYLWRTLWFFLGNEYARSGFPYFWRPSWWRGLFHQMYDYLRLECGKPHLGHNSLAGFAYTVFVIGLGFLQILTGYAIYSQSDPDGSLASLVGWAIPLFGGSMRILMWHHLFAWGFIVFAILHIYIVTLDARQYRNGLIVSMITGMKFKELDGDDEN